MFEKWHIPDYICDNVPIGYSNLDLFVGHEKDRKFLSSLISNKSIIVLEGEIGVGKTSLGNFIRFSKSNYFSPISEIPCKTHWNNDKFLGIILAAIVKEIMREDTKYPKLKKDKVIKELNIKFSDVKMSGFGLSAFGFGAQGDRSISRTTFLNQTVLLDYLQQIGTLIQKHLEIHVPIIIQLNNLDIKSAGNEDDLIRFFNEIRDTLQFPYISWVICGGSDLAVFLRNRVPRVSQIISHSSLVSPLSFKEVKEAFTKRIKKAEYKGSLPLADDLFDNIYKLSLGSFRQILNTIHQLLIQYCNEPLVEIISKEHAKLFFYDLTRRDIDDLKNKKFPYEVFNCILKNPGISQKNLISLVKRQQPNISRITIELQSLGFILIKKEGRTNYYFPELKYSFGHG